MTKLSVEVRDHDIIISSPETRHSITYRRVHHEPMLVALESMRDNPDRENLNFLVQAWKAAYSKAKALGWL